MCQVTLWVTLAIAGDGEHHLMSSAVLVVRVPVSLGSS